MSQHITIQLKTLSGDFFPLDVSPSASLEEIARTASVAHPEVFPPIRTKVLPIEEEQKEKKEYEDGDVLFAIVADSPVMEKGKYTRYDHHSEGTNTYVRWKIILRGETYYLYITGTWRSSIDSDVISPNYAIGKTETVTSPSETHCRRCHDLWFIIRTVVPDVTPKEMKELRQMTDPYLQQEARRFRMDVIQWIDPDEPIECGCGSVLKYSSLKGHQTKKKHKAWLKTQA